MIPPRSHVTRACHDVPPCHVPAPRPSSTATAVRVLEEEVQSLKQRQLQLIRMVAAGGGPAGEDTSASIAGPRGAVRQL